MLKIDRNNRSLSRLDSPTLKGARILERVDLQEYIFNSSQDFFAEIGERVFIIGKEVLPSDTVQDRIDLLGIDSEGNVVVVELKRGSDKLQMFQAISYAGMVARWNLEDFQRLATRGVWEQLTDFLEVDVEEINRSQRLLLIAEGYDYALLAGAEWLSERYGVAIQCSTISLATDQTTGAEYLACTSIFPPSELAEQATARGNASRISRPAKWSDWDDALESIVDDDLRAFVEQELATGRENYLRRRGLHYRINGKRRWSFYCRNEHAYVWQRGRFTDDVAFWQTHVSRPETVKPVKKGRAVSFNLVSAKDFRAFHKVVVDNSLPLAWLDHV